GQFRADLPVGADDEDARAGHFEAPTRPSSLPALAKTSTAFSRWWRSCTADICTRMRAWPLGTTGKKKPIAYRPCSRMRCDSCCALTASPIMIGTIGCSPGLISKPASVMALRNQAVLSASLSRSAVLDSSRSSTASEPATIAGITVLENRYGRE